MTLAVDEPVLLATKLRPPMHRSLVTRPRLRARLRPTEYRLTVLDAPAGWGKTSLLADWSAATEDGAGAAWLTLDAVDNDPVLFWTYAVAALRTRYPGLGEQALAALRAGGRALRSAVLPLLVNELAALPGPVVLVLDDYHLITDADVHATVSLLAERLPAHAHLVVAARGDPALPLGRLRAAGELLELRTDDLAFTDDEAAVLLGRVRDVALTDTQVRQLARRTEGWPTGLALAAASLAGRPERASRFVEEFTGTDRYVLDYLCSEVLARLPADVQRFLRETSILRRLSPAVCEAVTGRADSAALLDRIERAGVFLVPLDDTREWFRYHRLFGELLRHELSLSDPSRIAELHRRAAAWAAAAGAVGDAVEHHVAADQGAEAVELVAQHWNTWFNGGRLATVSGWLDLLPPALVRADPRMCAARAWLLLDLGRLDEVEEWLVAGDGAAADLAALRDMAVVRTVHRFKIGDVGAAAAAARRVVELESGEPGFAATVAHLMLGVTDFWCDGPEPARRPLGTAVRLARASGNALAETYALGYLALAAAEAGALDDAARLVPVALERALDPEVCEHFVAGFPHLADALLLAASGRRERAAEAAARALDRARRGSGRLELAFALAVRAQTGTASGEDCGVLLDEARALARSCPDPGRLVTRLARVRTAGPRAAPPTAAGPAAQLSERERDLLPLLAGSLSQREIGGVMHLSLNTVKTHSRTVFRKLGASSRSEAVARARELGLL